MADPRIRQMVIKTGVVKRLTKERIIYGKEVAIEQQRLVKFKTEGADDHVLRKQDEVIQECLMMLPDTIRRLGREYEALEKFLKEEIDLKETKEYESAAQILVDAKAVLDNEKKN